MDAISAEATITLNGRQYTLAKATVARLEEFVEWCKPKLKNPIVAAGEAIGGFPGQLQELLVRVAVQEGSSPLTISSPRIQALAGTTEGMAKLFHIMLKPNHPDVTIDDLSKWLGDSNAVDLQSAFNKISGTADSVGGTNPQNAGQ
jgi:hypothetical protein